MLHEHWRDYTEKEINDIKKKVCIGHNCPYLKYFNNSSKDDAHQAYCDYLCMTGHVPPRAEVCEHWKDEDVVKPEQPGRAFLTKEEHDWIKEQVPNVGKTDHYVNHVTKIIN